MRTRALIALIALLLCAAVPPLRVVAQTSDAADRGVRVVQALAAERFDEVSSLGADAVLQGERDYQVSMEDFGLWRQALSGRRNVTFKSYPALNHLFIAGVGKSTPAEYARAGHVATDVMEDIAQWLIRTAGKP